jgi:hypothetical protein
VPRHSVRRPSCHCWKRARDRGTVPGAQRAHGFKKLEEVVGNQDVAALMTSGWVDGPTTSGVPAVSTRPGSIAYGPVAQAPVDPDVVLLRLSPKAPRSTPPWGGTRRRTHTASGNRESRARGGELRCHRLLGQALAIARHSSTQARHATAHCRQRSISSCLSHSAAHASATCVHSWHSSSDQREPRARRVTQAEQIAAQSRHSRAHSTRSGLVMQQS